MSLVATLRPATTEARSCLSGPRNRRNLPGALYSGSNGTCMDIDMNTFTGRCCLSFGSSRLNDVQLHGDEIGTKEFNLILGLDQRLYIRNVSSRTEPMSLSSLASPPLFTQQDLPSHNSLSLAGNILVTVTASIRFEIDVADLTETRLASEMASYAHSVAEFSSTLFTPMLVKGAVPRGTARRRIRHLESEGSELRAPKRIKALSIGSLLNTELSGS